MLVASRGGDDQNPAWLYNLQADPEVEIEQDGRTRVPCVPGWPTPRNGAELWPRVVADHANYGSYQAKTDREIPVVVLDPVS